MKSYLKDSQSLIALLREVVTTEDLILGTCDVSSLHTCIPHGLGKKAIETCLRSDGEMYEEQIDFLIQCIDFGLTRNYFWFGKRFYNQATGTAMGAKFAPRFANLFMQSWEDEYLHSDKNPFLNNIILYRRYIDDCFIIWKGTETSFSEFITYINQNDHLKFTSESSKTNISFLDLEIFVEENRMKTKTFFKKTDVNSYIGYESHHHKPWIRNIPKGQFKRIQRNCTDTTDFILQAKVIKDRFLERNYREDMLDRAIAEVTAEGGNDQPNKIIIKKNKETEGIVVPFITGYSKEALTMKKAIQRNWHILKNDPVIGAKIPEKPRIIFRRAPNLKDHLTNSYIPEIKKKGPFTAKRFP